MASMYVYWRHPGFSREEGGNTATAIHQGFLTTDHDAADEEMPIVLVEEESERIYHPGDLPPETVLYVEAAPGELPGLAEVAKRAGYRVERA